MHTAIDPAPRPARRSRLRAAASRPAGTHPVTRAAGARPADLATCAPASGTRNPVGRPAGCASTVGAAAWSTPTRPAPAAPPTADLPPAASPMVEPSPAAPPTVDLPPAVPVTVDLAPAALPTMDVAPTAPGGAPGAPSTCPSSRLAEAAGSAVLPVLPVLSAADGRRRAARSWRRRARDVVADVRGHVARTSDAGMATAEYAIATVAAVGFAGLLLVVLRSGEVQGLLLGLIRRALSV